MSPPAATETVEPGEPSQPTAAEAAAAARPREPEPPKPQFVTVEPVEPERDSEQTLAEAAQRERERRRQAGEPIAVITDKNLSEHATGLLTFAEEEEEDESASAADGTDAAAEGDESVPAEAGEAYWRARVREIRERWREAADRVPELEERVAELRNRFYETDDPYYRDTRIKPAWDRAIDLIAQTRAEAESHRLELAKTLEEGRRAGALPGWLREGVELEPQPVEPEPEIHEPGEPKILEIEEGGGGP